MQSRVCSMQTCVCSIQPRVRSVQLFFFKKKKNGATGRLGRQNVVNEARGWGKNVENDKACAGKTSKRAPVKRAKARAGKLLVEN